MLFDENMQRKYCGQAPICQTIVAEVQGCAARSGLHLLLCNMFSVVGLCYRASSSCMVKTDAAHVLYTKGPIVTALALAARQVEQFFPPAPKVTIEDQPARKVKAQKAFEAGELVFAPDTNKVIVVKEGQKVPEQPEIKFVTSSTGKARRNDLRFFLSPCVAAENVNPFWCLGSTTTKEEANMKSQTLTVRSASTVSFGGPTKVKPTLAREVVPTEASAPSAAERSAVATKAEGKAGGKGKTQSVTASQAAGAGFCPKKDAEANPPPVRPAKARAF